MSQTRSSAMSLAITGIGMVSPLGLDAATGCAAARAGLNRAARLDSFKIYSMGEWSDVGVTGHALREFAGGFEGFGKFLRLGSGALGDLLRTGASAAPDWSRTALCIALPSGYLQSEQARQAPEDIEEEDAPAPTLLEALTDELPGRLCELASLPIPAAQQATVCADQAGFAGGLLHAWQLISTGAADQCIVGGIDACTDSRFLAAAHHFNVLKTEEQPSGLQPGEAAAFVMLENSSGAAARGARILGEIEAVAVGAEDVGRIIGKPALGIGLAQTVDRCLAAASREDDLGWVIADLNGDAFRANDWGYAQVRLIAAHPFLKDCPVVIPAESFGETGAAQGALATCMAVRAFARGYSPAPRALVWSASYGGPRGAFVIGSAA